MSIQYYNTWIKIHWISKLHNCVNLSYFNRYWITMFLFLDEELLYVLLFRPEYKCWVLYSQYLNGCTIRLFSSVVLPYSEIFNQILHLIEVDFTHSSCLDDISYQYSAVLITVMTLVRFYSWNHDWQGAS